MNGVNGTQKRILFVDSQPAHRRDISSRFIAVNPDWEFLVALNRAHAMRVLSKQPVDAVVAALGPPEEEGVQLLAEVMQQHPETFRFVIMDLAHWPLAMKCLGVAHRFLVRPCDPVMLRGALERAFAFETWLPTDRVCKLLTRLKRVPSPPTLYYEVVRELQSAHASLESVGLRIAQDPAMTAKLLQLVNSAVFGLSRPVVSAGEAVLYLGIETTKALILLAHSFASFDELRDTDFSVEELWRHSMATANFARCIAAAEGCHGPEADEAFTAGLLHDLGKLALAANLGDDYRRAVEWARERGVVLTEGEQEILGSTHAEVGACLLAMWGLPPTIVEALALHHHPVQLLSHGFCSLTAVHAANAFEHQVRRQPWETKLDIDYLAALERQSRVEPWRQACQAEAQRHASRGSRA
jgi:putative nucleotidyltransferase with HDIG domain